MENLLKDRIKERLDALQINPFEAARRAGADRTFINDLLVGKKKTIRSSTMIAVAAALDCDAGYLIGTQDAPRSAAASETPEKRPDGGHLSLPLAGVAEAGAWRLSARPIASPALPVAPDPRFPAKDQSAYLIRGDHAAWMGAHDGSVVVAVAGAGYRDGDVLLVRRIRAGSEGPEQELTLRKLAGGKLSAVNGGQEIEPGADSVEIVARAISAHQVF